MMTFDGPFRELPWYKKVVLIPFWIFVCLPFVLVLGILIFLPLGIFVFLHNFMGEQLFYLRMRSDGRTLSRRALRHRLQSGETGTFIIETPTMGWRMTHAWWTPDDLLALAPTTEPLPEEYEDLIAEMRVHPWETRVHPWDEWCWQEYLSPFGGKAFLLKVWNGKKYQQWVERYDPAIPVVKSWSAIAHLNEIEAQNEANR